jgi:hypothetical protein
MSFWICVSVSSSSPYIWFLCQAEAHAGRLPTKGTLVKASRAQEASPYSHVDDFIQNIASVDETPGRDGLCQPAVFVFAMRPFTPRISASLLFEGPSRSCRLVLLFYFHVASHDAPWRMVNSDVTKPNSWILPPARLRNWSLFAERGVLVYNVDNNRYCERIGRQHKSNNGEGHYLTVDMLPSIML